MIKEYVPSDAYGLLRRLTGKGPQRVRREQVALDDPATYLIARGLATSNSSGDRLEDTEAGRRVGLVEWEPSAARSTVT
jgi:hypothetical protein